MVMRFRSNSERNVDRRCIIREIYVGPWVFLGGVIDTGRVLLLLQTQSFQDGLCAQVISSFS